MRSGVAFFASFLLIALQSCYANGVCWKTANTWPVQICDTVICNNARRESLAVHLALR